VELQTLVDDNLYSAFWFRPELALTFGSMLVFALDLWWRRHPARVKLLTGLTLVVLGVTTASTG
jgi:NADH-quinone oxidoreductase subunit N